jgi:phosphocarrier protein HPr
MSNSHITTNAMLTNHTGLHARPSIKLTKIAKASSAHVEIALSPDGPWINAKSPVKVMGFRASVGASIYFRASGLGAQEVIDELVALVMRNFDEDDAEELSHA